LGLGTDIGVMRRRNTRRLQSRTIRNDQHCSRETSARDSILEDAGENNRGTLGHVDDWYGGHGLCNSCVETDDGLNGVYSHVRDEHHSDGQKPGLLRTMSAAAKRLKFSWR